MQKIALAYKQSPLEYFRKIQHLEWAVLLDSGCVNGVTNKLSRYDIMTAKPLNRLVFNDSGVNVLDSQGNNCYTSNDVYNGLDFLLKKMPEENHDTFVGGLIGYLSYDVGSEDFKPTIKQTDGVPLSLVGLYQWCLIIDHKLNVSYLASWDENYHLSQWQTVFEQKIEKNNSIKTVTSKIRPLIDASQYLQAFAKIQRYLSNGDCYQVNFAQSFVAKVVASAFDLYEKLKNNNAVPFGAFLNYQTFQVLSFSPECFLELKNRAVKTYPIKGTSKREKSRKKDQLSKQTLLKSAKDKAENVMIVDLMRNDLGKVCTKGSIKVNQLFSIFSYQYVHHLQSEIQGKLEEGKTILDLLKSCFPGGSITGAPKKRAMEIIDELETDNREIYCGSIFYMTKHTMLSSIAIRTAVQKNQQIKFWAGGGIVNDSQVQSEFQESLDKAKVFSELVEK